MQASKTKKVYRHHKKAKPVSPSLSLPGLRQSHRALHPKHQNTSRSIVMFLTARSSTSADFASWCFRLQSSSKKASINVQGAVKHAFWPTVSNRAAKQLDHLVLWCSCHYFDTLVACRLHHSCFSCCLLLLWECCCWFPSTVCQSAQQQAH